MIRFKPHNLVGRPDVQAMTAALTRIENAPHQPLPLDLLAQLRCLGIEIVWPEPTGGGVSIPHAGTVA